ncbi:MAG: helix-turn-helix domain-containing protein [Candidatus Paceibacterota bacterium]
MNIENILQTVGFSRKKTKIYLAILELGEASVIEIAKKAGIKRTTVYNILPELIIDGLVKKSVKNKKGFFFIEDPSLIKTSLEEKMGTIEKSLPELRAMQNTIPSKPRITFYEGGGGAKALYRDTLDSLTPGDTLLSYTGLTDFYKLIPKDFSEWYIKERIKRKIRIEVIALRSKITDEWQKNAARELREIKIVNNSDFRFDGDTEIYGNKIALISYKENFMGVIIESKEISQMLRMAFRLMWNSLE